MSAPWRVRTPAARCAKSPAPSSPIADGKNRRFALPRHGRTVLVCDGKSGKVLHRLAWDGEKFAEETEPKR